MGEQREPGVRLVVSLYREFEQVSRRGDLSMAQYRTLLYLMDGPRRAGELAAASAVTRPTVSAMIASLRDQGWVEEAVDPSDGRVTKIELTRAGRERVLSYESTLAARMAELMPGVSPEQLAETMDELYLALSSTREERLANVFGRPRTEA
ncbi:MAG: MarR family winged helix-turn-helix transcriptional regulator [Acidimicrobiales bacterium]